MNTVFAIDVKETNTLTVYIKANSQDEALERAKELYQDQDIQIGNNVPEVNLYLDFLPLNNGEDHNSWSESNPNVECFE